MFSVSSIVKSENIGFSVDNFFKEELPLGPISVCSEKDTVGYRWNDNNWEKGNFQLSTYIIQKKEHRKITDEKFKYCHTGLKNKYDDDKDYLAHMRMGAKGLIKVKILKRCYSIKMQGNKFDEISPPVEFCREIYDYKTKKILKISCKNNISFNPSGNFIKRQIHSNITKMSKYKDSLYISHGVCSSLR